MNTLSVPQNLPQAARSPDGPPPARWRPRLGLPASLVLHGLALALLYHWHANPPAQPAEERLVELVLAPPQAVAPPPAPRPPPPAEAPPVQPPRQIRPPAPAPAPRPAPARPRPAPPVAAPPSAVAAPAEPSPTAAAPAAPAADSAPSEPSAPAAPSAPPAAPAAPSAAAQAGPGIPSDYVNQVHARINRIASGRYPRAAALRRQEGRVGYTLLLAADGRLIRFELEPSGIEALDRAAAEALEAAAPFPPLPDLGGGTYRVSGAIAYRLSR